MNLKQLTVGAFAALSLGFTALPAHAYIMFWNGGYGGNIFINGDQQNQVSSYDSGWYSGTGLHYSNNPYTGVSGAGDPALINNSYLVTLFGADEASAAHYDYFVFDLQTLANQLGADTLTTAMIQVQQGSSPSVPGSSDPATTPEYLRLGSTAVRFSDMVDTSANKPLGLPIFSALGAGDTQYGIRPFSVADDNSEPVFALSQGFITDINTALDNFKSNNGDQYFVMGGRLANEAEIADYKASLVPEPASWALMIVGFLGTGVALRARRRAALA